MHQIIHIYNLHTMYLYSTSIFSFSVQEPEHSPDGDDHQNLTNLTVTLPTTTLF